MPRKKTFQAMREAERVGPYDDLPMLPDDLQLQVHLSRNDRPQPFHQIFEKDTLLFLLSGSGAVQLKDSPVAHFAIRPGDCLYVPAGVPHRIVPDEESVMLRYKPRPAGLEGVAWYCTDCNNELYRRVWNANTVVSQAMFDEASREFALEATRRKCPKCGVVHPPPDLSGFRWTKVAEELGALAAAAAP
jgi:mannose-6-phosphate isomerase-like protein (cupin superfamily)